MEAGRRSQPDPFAIQTHIKSLCCPPETNISFYVSYTSSFNLKKKKKKETALQRTGWGAGEMAENARGKKQCGFQDSEETNMSKPWVESQGGITEDLADPGRRVDFPKGPDQKAFQIPYRCCVLSYIFLIQGNVNAFLIWDRTLALLSLSQPLLTCL